MTKKKKIFSVISLVLVAIFLVSGIITAIVINSRNVNSREQVTNFYKNQLERYERLANDSDVKDYTLSSAVAHKSDIYQKNYLMNIYTETGVTNIQMKINSIGKLYLLEFKDSSNTTFFGKKYIMQLGTNNSFKSIYEISGGKIVKTYESTEASFFTICDKLQKFIPDNYCGKKTYTSYKVYSDSLNTTFILYGQNTTLLFNEDYYYEETSNSLVRIKPNDGKYLFKFPKDIR